MSSPISKGRKIAERYLRPLLSKKAVELQFHWMFVLIAGALILTFFITIAQRQYTFSQQKAALQTLNSFETTFTTALQSPNTANPIEINTEMNFRCEKSCDCAYSIGDQSKRFDDKIIFAPDKLAAEETAYLWTQSFEIPYLSLIHI